MSNAIENYDQFKSYQDLYRTTPIKNKDLLISIDCMLPFFLEIDFNNTTLDHLVYDERLIDFFKESNGLYCPLCGCILSHKDFNKYCFNCSNCNTLFNPLDESANSSITSYLNNTMKETICQEKNQNFQEKSEKKVACSNKQLQSKDLETLDFYLDKYNQEPITDAKERKKIEKLLPNYLHIDKKKPTLDHFYYDTTIVDNLQKAEKGSFICPICHSGLGEKKSGALSFNDKAQYFHCFACEVSLFPISLELRNSITSLLIKVNFNSDKKVKREEFQDNIDDFYKQLQEQDLELSRDEKKTFIEKIFANRSYSSETIDYIVDSKDFLIADEVTANNKNIKGLKRLYVTVYDTNLLDIIGFQKLFYESNEEALSKYWQYGSMQGFTLLSKPEHPNCTFIVESATNALAILDCGFNAVFASTKNKKPFQIYSTLLQNGYNPIIFLDRDVEDINRSYTSIDWKKDIEINFSPNELKEKADASDLLVLDKLFLCDILRKAYNTYFKKLCYSDISLEEAFQSKAKLNIIQAPIGIGKTTEALKIVKNACYPLYSVYTKELTEEIGSKVALNVVNSDNPIIKDPNIGIVTTHARLGKTTEMQDYAVYSDEKPFDIAVIDETHKFIKEESTTIVQPYICEVSDEEENTDYRKAFNNQELTSKCKEGASIECISYKREENKQAISPIKMANEVTASDVAKYQKVFLNREYSVKELTTPENYPIAIQGTSNIRAMKIDANNAYWIAKYTLDDSIDAMLSYEYDEIKKELKESFKKVFGNIRNLSIPLAMLFFRNIYVVCAFPIRKKDKKVLSFEEWKEDTRKGVEMENANNDAIYFKVYLRFVNLQPLVQILKKSKQVFLIGASDFIYKEAFIKEFSQCYGDNFRYYNLAPKDAKKELETNVIKLKKVNDDEILQIMKQATSIDVYKCFVFATYDRADDFYKWQQRIGINTYARATKEGCKSLFSDEIELQTIDNKVVNNAFYNLIIHGNAPILESSNKLAQYTLMFLDCNQYKPKIAYANPYLEDLGMNIIDQLKVKLIQQIGRLYRQQGNRIVLVLMNNQAIEFDLVNVLKEKSEEVKIFEDSANYTYYKDPKCFVENVQKCLAGEEMAKYKARKHAKQSSEQKDQRKAEKQEQKQAKIIDKIANGASERELEQNIRGFSNFSMQEKLAYYKQVVFNNHVAYGESPFSDAVLSSYYVTYDIEVFPNVFIICFHDEKGNGYSKRNPSYNWLCHFLRLPLIGFNNANYDNLILYKALNLLHPNHSLILKEKFDFNKELKAFSNRIIEKKEYDKDLSSFQRRSRAIGFGDALEMIVKNLTGKSDWNLKSFQLDYGLSIMETPYPFDKVLTDDEIEDVVKYCLNDSLTVYLMIQNEQSTFQSWLELVDQACLNGNYTRSDIMPEIIFNKELSYKERCQYNSLTLDCISKVFPNFKYIAGVEASKAYVNEYDDYLYILGDGGFNLLPKNVFRKVRNGDKIELIPIENNHAFYEDVVCLDIQSMHPNSAININYFGKYTLLYKSFLDMKNICSLLKEKGFDYVQKELAQYGVIVNSKKDVKNKKATFKFILNSTYGLTCKKDKKTGKMKVSPLNKCGHNVIALYGSCFMTSLHHALITKYPNIVIIQIKTDSIKIANCTQEYIDFCHNFAKDYNYVFETEANFKGIVCNGNEFQAISLDNELVKTIANTDEEAELENTEVFDTECKGSFKILYDDRGILRTKDDLRTLLFRKKKGKTIHKLGIKKSLGNKETIEYVQDVKSTKVRFYLAVKEEYGYYVYYDNKKGSKTQIFKDQKFIPIYDLKDFENLDNSMIDYSYYQGIVDKKLDFILDLMLEKRVTKDELKKISKQNIEKRQAMKIALLTNNELYFFNILKNQLAFV